MSKHKSNWYEKFLASILIAGSLFFTIIIYVDVPSHIWHWWTFLTFTVISNFTVSIIYFLRAWNIVDINTYVQKIIQICATTLLSITFLGFWILIAASAEKVSGIVTFASIWVHGINPLLVFVFFVWESRYRATHKISFWESQWCMAIPGLWVIMQQILFYTKDVYFYPFLDLTKHSYVIIYFYLVMILFISSIIGMGWTIFSNYLHGVFNKKLKK